MSVLSPPDPRQDELELLIREARARQRKRRLGAAALLAVIAGAALGIHALVTVTHRRSAAATGGGTVAVRHGYRCGIRVAGSRIIGPDGTVAYRDPYKGAMSHDLRCSGSTVWVIFINGVGMMHEEYVGVRSSDRGRTWRVAFAQDPRVHAKYGIDAEVGPWTLRGSRAAYLVGTCPACSVGTAFGTVSLTVTKDGGTTFRRYSLPGLTGYGPTRIRVSGHGVTITGRRLLRKINSPPFEIYTKKAVTLHVA